MPRHLKLYAGGVAAAFAIAALVFWLGRTGKASAARTGANDQRTLAHRQLWHCGMHPQVIEDHPGNCPICHMKLTPLGAGSSGKQPVIEIDPRVVQNMGVRTPEVAEGRLEQTVTTVGIISVPESGLHDVSLKVNGWVANLYANQEGMHVHKGDPLFDIYSPELLVAAEELLSAQKGLDAFSLDASDAVKSEARSLVETARRKLRLWDVSDGEIDAILKRGSPPQTITFRSPATGHVEEKMVVEGAAVTAGMKLLRIADHSTMWLTLDVYTDQISLVSVGTPLTASIEGIPDKTFEGNVSFVYPRVDPATRTLKVRTTLDNKGLELKSGMYATAELHIQADSDTLLCPAEAVIDTGARQIVFVAQDANHFVATRVHVGLHGDDDQVQILDGLSPGDQVVTSGQFLMDVESKTIEAIMKLSGGDETIPMNHATSKPDDAAHEESR